MKRIAYLIMGISVISLIIFGCTAGPTSYTITFQNNASTAATLKVGNNTFWAASGGNTYNAYFIEQDKAAISVSGVSIEGAYFGMYEVKSVNLKFGYQYNFILTKSGDDYVLIVSPVKVGDEPEISEVLNF